MPSSADAVDGRSLIGSIEYHLIENEVKQSGKPDREETSTCQDHNDHGPPGSVISEKADHRVKRRI
jgi:hypothetical protein